jgi:signal peptidase
MIYYLSVSAILATASVVPLSVGWRPLVLTSGSMRPALDVGDVVLVETTPAWRLRQGDIAVVHDPAMPERLLSHRVVSRTAAGGLVLRGDANAQPDSTPVPPDHVIGTVRAVVPYIGLVAYWQANDRPLFFGWLASLIVACWVAMGTSRRGRGGGGRQGTPAGDRPHEPGDDQPAGIPWWPRSDVAEGLGA